MVQHKFTFAEFHFSSALMRDLVAEIETIHPFISAPFSVEKMVANAKTKPFSQSDRARLVTQLHVQNQHLQLSQLSTENITSFAAENTFAITTGHQLNLVSGPLYSIYKVAQVIALAKEAKLSDSTRNFVPVFWMATEDHDFEEINHIHLFGKKLSWEKEGQVGRIAGRIETAGMNVFLDEILALFRDEVEREHVKKILNVYVSSANLAGATRELMNLLFGEFGLVIIDGDDAELKKSFAPIAQKEVHEGFVFSAVSETNIELEKLGYHAQVFVRECNLFFIDGDGTRLRIGKEADVFTIGEDNYTATQLVDMIHENPAQFSPNALLRPVYQELVLPNLAYIGGGGEIAYWMQIKGVFDRLKLAFPLLRVRDSFVLLRGRELKDLQSLDMSLTDLKRDLHEIVREMALEEVEVEIELNEERERLNRIMNDLLAKASKIDPGMKGLIEAEFVKMDKSIERIESKFIKAEKAKHEQKANKIQKLQHKIYPNGGFQERYENFLPYLLADPQFISKIVDNLKPENQPYIKLIEIV